MNQKMEKYMTQVFQLLHEYRDKVKHDLTILEVGAGSAANFLPLNTKLICLDPNPHFDGYIKKSFKEHDTLTSVEIIQGFAEKMPLNSESFDSVICTFVLCSVKDIEMSLKEIKRVMKKTLNVSGAPNIPQLQVFVYVSLLTLETDFLKTFLRGLLVADDGQFVFMEHVAANKNSWTWHVKCFMNPLHWFFADGCEVKRNIDKFIKEAGFSELYLETFYPKLPFWIKRCIFGVATKIDDSCNNSNKHFKYVYVKNKSYIQPVH